MGGAGGVNFSSNNNDASPGRENVSNFANFQRNDFDIDNVINTKMREFEEKLSKKHASMFELYENEINSLKEKMGKANIEINDSKSLINENKYKNEKALTTFEQLKLEVENQESSINHLIEKLNKTAENNVKILSNHTQQNERSDNISTELNGLKDKVG